MSYNPTLFEASDWWKATNCGTRIFSACHVCSSVRKKVLENVFVLPDTYAPPCGKSVWKKEFCLSCMIFLTEKSVRNMFISACHVCSSMYEKCRKNVFLSAFFICSFVRRSFGKRFFFLSRILFRREKCWKKCFFPFCHVRSCMVFRREKSVGKCFFLFLPVTYALPYVDSLMQIG